ncbi:hypothetical protein ACMZ5F_13240 [Streptomyces rhizosphaericola]|uniref:hypothetical protein n=1 Tax=Streptomyces TaxID=1883 RepID=UPI00048B2D35|nr:MULTISPECIES: hypothetical protein [unclassified Streptomyces]MYT93214.1 hypothetical protein [Streptomyces sp. SID8359]
MPRWGLLVEQNLGFGGQRRVWSGGVVDHVDGTREEALEVLRQRAEEYRPVHPTSPKRRRLYRERDGFVLVLDGAWQSFHCRFTVIEQLYDSAERKPVPQPEAVPRPPDDREPEQDPRPEPGHPLPPAPMPPTTPASAPAEPRAWDAGVPEVPSWLNRDRPS